MATLVDSRRLTGPNLVLDGAGATIDVECAPEEREPLARAWQSHARTLLDAVGWTDMQTASRPVPTGVSLAFSAPIDALYAACEISEWAWEQTSGNGDDREDLESARARITAAIAEERNPAVLALRDAARERNLPFLWDDDEVSIGYGTRSRTWPARDCPAPGDVEWDKYGAVPVVVVTGTNGKTTTVRLLAQIARAAGLTPGFSSTDGIWVGGDLVDSGDYSGPGGARAVLRDPRVDFAILETARGGLQRRGVGVDAADVASVLNVSADHLGEYGVETVDDLTDIKFLVTHVVGAGGHVVLNADDPRVAARREDFEAEVALFSLDPHSEMLEEWRGAKRPCAYAGGDSIVIEIGGAAETIAKLDDLPITFGGTARHNVANALAASLIAEGAGLSRAAIRDGLQSFRPSAETLPGRTNLYEIREKKVLVDFAHNPDGHAALLHMASQLPADRWCVVLGQAGDRDNGSIIEMAKLTAAAQPAHVFIKEMKRYLRGREEGEIPHLIESTFREAGYESYSHHASELDAVEAALAWSRPGDLLLFPLHESRDEVTKRLEELARDA